MQIDTGKAVAYGGGTGVSVVSASSKAAVITPDPGPVLSILNAPLFHLGDVIVSLSDIVSIGGISLVAIRLAFDIYKYFDQRRRKGAENESVD